jgi:hypothetical protein
MFQVCAIDIDHVYSILFCLTTFVTRNYGKESIDTVDVTLATDDDKQLKAHNIIYKAVSFQL